MYSNKYIYLLLLLFFLSCKKGEKKEYPAEPSIEFISITPSSMTEGQSKIIISFKYSDGDGDLGENNPDVNNLFVTDNRLGITYSYRIKQLTPTNSVIPITGTLNTETGTVFISDGSAQQTVNFSLYIVDRAGHASNTITTSPVTIIAQ
ncbi:MAG: hypothetical protein ABI772_15145 [Bacteroidota bacterium]